MNSGNELLAENEKLLNNISTRQSKLKTLSAYLSELESQLSLLFAASPDIIVFLDKDDKIIKISDASRIILGYSKEEMIGRYIWEFITHRDLDQAKKQFQKIKNKKIVYFDKKNTFVNVWLDKNNEEVKLAWRFSVCDERENYTIGVATDITEFGKNAYNAKLMQSAIEASTDGIIILDAQSKNTFVYVNAAYENITGFTSDELMGKMYSFTLTERSKESKAYKLLTSSLEKGKGCDVLLECLTKDGKVFYNRLAISSVIEQNMVVNFIGISRDITDKIGVRYDWSSTADNGFIQLNKIL